MYSDRVVAETIRSFARKNGWEPQFHSVAECDFMVQEINKYTNIEKSKTGARSYVFWKDDKAPSKATVKKIKRWVANERFLCNPPEAPIWMADFTFKPIGEIKVGDKIIGWKREIPQTKRNKGKTAKPKDRICVSEVQAVMRRKAHIVKVTMASGKVIRCTPDHNWSNGHPGWRHNSPWINVAPGRWLRPLVDIYPNDPSDLRTASWLGGVYDGEGHGAHIFQSPFHNPTLYLEIYRAFQKLGFSVTADPAPTNRACGSVRLTGGLSSYAQFLAWCKPVRKSSLENMVMGYVNCKPEQIVSVEYDCEDEVVSMQTSTGNYVAWGYMSKNCFASAEYFVTRYAHIRAANTQIIHFDLRLSQRILLTYLAECDDLQIAIQLFVLKARQLGISTFVAQLFLQRILYVANTYAVMASVQVPQTQKLKNMIDTCQDKLPTWLRVGQTSTKTTEPRWTNGSRLSVQAGAQEVGIAQGDSPSCVHISELGDYTNPKHTLDQGLFPACHQLPSLFMVLEGTGSMATTWQKESWELYSSGKGRFKAFFIPPACATDLYPPESWLRQHPLPEPWESHVTDVTRKMRRRGELYVRSTEYLTKVLGQRWEMPREFQWFWQFGYKEAIAKHAEREFLAANAVTPNDAFQSKDDPVFTQETITLVTEAREKSYAAYAITGRTILMGNENKPYEPEPVDVNPNEPNIVLDWKGLDDNEYRWNLVPLRPFDESTDEACFDKLLIFEELQPGAEYCIAIDTAGGLNKPNEDRGTLSVQKHGHGKEPDIQVASFTSLRVNSPQMARIAAAVAVLYGTDGNGNITSANQLVAKFIIEQTRKSGDECQSQLKIMGFLDHHIMLRIDKKGNIDPNSGHSEGWWTRQYTRPYLLDRWVDAVNTGWMVLNDPIVIRQLATFVRKYTGEHGKSEMIASTGQKDDNIFASAMGWTTFHELENASARIQSKWPLAPKVKEVMDEWASRSMLVPGY